MKGGCARYSASASASRWMIEVGEAMNPSSDSVVRRHCDWYMSARLLTVQAGVLTGVSDACLQHSKCEHGGNAHTSVFE